MVLKGSEMVMRVGLWKTIRKEWYFIRAEFASLLEMKEGSNFGKMD